MRQIVYISSVRIHAAAPVDVDAILSVSRANNRRDGLTGLLFYNGRRFLQVLEGAPATIDATLARIARDARHCAMVVLSDRIVAQREFGDWAMAAHDPASPDDDALARIDRLTALAAPSVRATFRSFAALRPAA